MASRPLRIVRLIARLNIGGPARHVTILNRGLRERGHDTVLVFGPVDAGEGSLEDLASSMPVRRVPELGRRLRFGGDVVAFARILHLMFALRPDVVHTHTAKAGALGRLAALVFNWTRRRAHRALVVHTFHGHVLSGYFGSVGDWLVRTTERLLATVTDCVIAISEGQRADLTDRFSVCPSSKVTVVPLGLDLDDLLDMPASFPSLRDTLAIPAGAVVVGYVGRFVPIKNLSQLLEAFALVVRAEPGAVLIMAGDGPLRGPLEAHVASLGLEMSLRFTGWQRDLRSLYATCDVVALTSLSEGTPVALIEAMAAGRAVVGTAVGGVPDVITHERTGLLVPPTGREAIAAALIRLVGGAAFRRQLGHAARDDVRARFRSERLVRDVEGLYAAGLGRVRAPVRPRKS